MAVSRLNNAMLVVETDTKQLAASLRTISRLADNISGKVSALDVAKTRVVECLQLAGDMHDLDAGQNVSHSYEVLTNAAARLKEILEKKLETAVEAEDIPSMQRFVKLFPLINEHDSGLTRFGKYLSKQIVKIGSDNLKFVMINGDDFGDDEEKKRRLEEEKARRKKEREKKLDQLLNRSLVGSKMQELLGNYLLLEQYYMQESVRKAIDMDAKEEGLLSSVVDDVLFLVRKCVRRAMSSGSVDCVCAALNYGVALLETTYYQHLHNTIQAGYPSTNFAAEALQTAQNAYNVIQHGKTTDPDVQRDTFITAANNARGTAELLLDLRKGLEYEWSKTQRSSVETGKLEHAVGQLADVSRKMHHLATLGMESLCKTAFRTKLKTSCDAFLDLPHTLTDVQLAEFEAVDPFIEQFNANLDKQIASFESVLHKENFQSLLLAVCSEAESQLERVIMKCSFNRLGGLQLDREFRQLSAYLSGVAGWTARERCARLSQIVALLNVENVDEAIELREATRTSPIARMLSANDTIKVLELRVDLPAAVIQKLEF
ncbi:hypothetical protein TELCIR_15273 [Teladorsagia circumcincta]|uniref:Conserved oligomeric Golgi complex subunit 4 n=1 Tax=Teladorsagia circumcincta TaxID=45464 RepID=A0A2G9TYS6_TELCI|nr:hypothetical protein TELCIR_15273 [Teladorsagia circumcincta]